MSGPYCDQQNLKAEIDKTLHRAEELLQKSGRLLEEYREAVQHTRRIIEQSLKLMAKRTGDRS